MTISEAIKPGPYEGVDGLPPEDQDETVFEQGDDLYPEGLADDPAKGRGIVPPYVGETDGISPDDYDDIEDSR